MTTHEIIKCAKAASRRISLATSDEKNAALLAMAQALEENCAAILAANAKDVEASRGVISDVMIDRLTLSPERIAGMAKGVREVADLPDPVGRVLARVTRQETLNIEKVSVPLGVVAISTRAVRTSRPTPRPSRSRAGTRACSDAARRLTRAPRR
ncbi:MAG: gamma-glutamyl-phosphate reductase, partial [Clostridia bacterium]|nr:gamma-glutamyl-phosphate reductase [Clostridia bacterium]